MFVLLGFLFSWSTLTSGVCVHDLSTYCHDYKKSDCTANQWMQINCCEFCGLNSGSSLAVNGNWGQWSSWSTCSQSCGNGSMTRNRHCNNPTPANGGLPCPGSAQGHHSCILDDCPGTCLHDLVTTCHNNKKSDCATNQWMQLNCCHFCGSHSGGSTHAVNGHWGQWSSYSSCSTSCGNGTMTRNRQCNNPAPAHGGAHCHGSANEHTFCNLVACPVDGHWSSWTSWGSCSASCGNGTMTRSRVCNNPIPSHGGSVCHGSSRETQACHLQYCPVGLTCLSCQGAIFPHTCDTVEHCGSHSVCSMERYFDGSGNILYNLGCKDAAFCHPAILRSAPIAEPNITNAGNHKRSNIPVCRECCSTGICNSAGCGNTGYAAARGPLCFACSQQVTANSCNTIKMCGRDEDCYIEGRQFGSVHYYHSGCKTKTICDGTGSVGIVGRDVKDKSKRQTFSCERCCTGDLCNHESC